MEIVTTAIGSITNDKAKENRVSRMGALKMACGMIIFL